MKALGYFAVVTGKGKHKIFLETFCIWNLLCLDKIIQTHDSFVGSSNESIDSIKDYEEDFFQKSRLLRWDSNAYFQLSISLICHILIGQSFPKLLKGWHVESSSGDHKEPESCCVRLLLEDGQGVSRTTSRCLQR